MRRKCSGEKRSLAGMIEQAMASEAVRYVAAGGMTTAVNYIIYLALAAVRVHYLAANVLAWCGAVVFAFFINRSMVFHAEGGGVKAFLQFGSARLLTLGLETVLLAALVQWAGIPAFFAKLVVSVVTVVLNYVVCKYGIFKEGKAGNGGACHAGR